MAEKHEGPGDLSTKPDHLRNFGKCIVLESLISLLRKYADLPRSLADATVVRLCELNHKAIVWTLDSHFRIYRHLGRRMIPLLDWPRD